MATWNTGLMLSGYRAIILSSKDIPEDAQKLSRIRRLITSDTLSKDQFPSLVNQLIVLLNTFKIDYLFILLESNLSAKDMRIFYSIICGIGFETCLDIDDLDKSLYYSIVEFMESNQQYRRSFVNILTGYENEDT